MRFTILAAVSGVIACAAQPGNPTQFSVIPSSSRSRVVESIIFQLESELGTRHAEGLLDDVSNLVKCLVGCVANGLTESDDDGHHTTPEPQADVTEAPATAGDEKKDDGEDSTAAPSDIAPLRSIADLLRAPWT